MRKIFTLLAVVLSVAMATAQTRTITGRVTDKNGLPVEGASVQIKGSTVGTSANQQGNFSISAKNGDVIAVSSINFSPNEVRVSNQDNLSVVLEPLESLMDEVIVTAGGIKVKRKEQGTANTVIKAETLVTGKSVSIAGGLQGKVAGLQINGTGGGVNPNYRLILRGQRSLTGNNQALIVLDNVIVPNISFR